MSKVLKAVGAIAGIAAMIPGPHMPFAAAAAGLAQIGSRILAPKPVARGSITQAILAAEPPRPYLMGECYSAGVIRHRVGYGATLKNVPNPYLWIPVVYSSVGPVESLVQKQFDFSTITSYYTDFYDTDEQLGARPESTALVPPYGTAPGWTSSSKLSGCAAIGWNFLFDKDGKVFASGLPAYGAIWKGEKCYDPRLDTTRSGGSGAHRVDDETTWEYTTNPALHAGTYAYGRYEGTKKIFGVGIADDGIDWATVATWANDCDTNSWEVHGTIYEGGEQSGSGVKTRNLDDICAAGGGRWLMAGAVLSFDWHRSRVSLATFDDTDIMEAGADLIALQTHRDRFNAVRPQYRSPSHNWELITAEKITGSTYVTEDGEEKAQVWPLNLVKDGTQAGQLATYAMADSREIGPINVPLGIDWGFYRPGDTLTWESEALDDTLTLVILERTPDPITLETTFAFKTETASKHAYALGESATAPATPVIGQTGEERDQVTGYVSEPRGAFRLLEMDPEYPLAPGDGEIVVTAFDGTLDDGRVISFPADTITGLTVSTIQVVFWDLQDEDYVTVAHPTTSEVSSSRYVRIGTAAISDSGTYPSETTPPDGWLDDRN